MEAKYLAVSLLNDDHGISWQSMIFLLNLLSEKDKESVLNHARSTESRWYIDKESAEILVTELKNNW